MTPRLTNEAAFKNHGNADFVAIVTGGSFAALVEGRERPSHRSCDQMWAYKEGTSL